VKFVSTWSTILGISLGVGLYLLISGGLDNVENYILTFMLEIQVKNTNTENLDHENPVTNPVQIENACEKGPREFAMSGKIVDANTNQGISGAQLVVLVPDTLIYEYDAFLDSSSILAQAVTDRLGNYTLSRRLRNDRKYSMFINAVRYKRYKSDEQLMKTCDESLTMNFMMKH